MDPATTAAADAAWMDRALRLAALGQGRTWPNPSVGCVLVRDGRLLGEGRTAPRPATGPQEHAEVAALAAAAAAGASTRGSTAYVTLAPCTRRSTPGVRSCHQALAEAGVARVVVALADPHQADSLSRLSAQGMALQVGPGAAVAEHLHGGFLSRIQRGRPRLTGKWAMTLDGFLAAGTGQSGWISSTEALSLSRRRRRAFDGILVGSGTVLADDPGLLAAPPRVSPRRIVVSASARLPPTARLFSALPAVPLLVIHGREVDPVRRTALAAAGVDLLALDDPHDPLALALALGRYGFNDVLVEGGATLHGAFLRAGLYDRLELYQGATTLAGGLPVCRGQGAPSIPAGQRWCPEAPPRLLGSTVHTRWRQEDPRGRNHQSVD